MFDGSNNMFNMARICPDILDETLQVIKRGVVLPSTLRKSLFLIWVSLFSNDRGLNCGIGILTIQYSDGIIIFSNEKNE